jgi:uncharacterized membrane protein (TIGR02234 family)
LSSDVERQPDGVDRGPNSTLPPSSSRRPSSPRRELTLTLLLGALGAGLILLATRQGWAQVQTTPPRPLPASKIEVTGAALVPYADALVVAGLATLAAVLASRRLLRRLAGGLFASIGLSLVASAFTLSRATAITAATANISPASSSAASVTDGSGAVSGGTPDVAGTAPHVIFAAAGWQALVVVGGIAMVVAGLLIAWRAERMAVMSSRYDSPASTRLRPPATQGSAAGTPSDSASIWEALSRGDDPTSAGSRTA